MASPATISGRRQSSTGSASGRPGGQVFTPFASVRGDVFTLDPTSTMAPAPDRRRRSPVRVMPAVGARMELADPGDARALVARVRADRADHRAAGRAVAGELPNNDAAEPGVRRFHAVRSATSSPASTGSRAARALNVGVRYLGTFNNDVVLEALFGQSFSSPARTRMRCRTSPIRAPIPALRRTIRTMSARVALDSGSEPRGLRPAAGSTTKTSRVQRGEIEATRRCSGRSPPRPPISTSARIRTIQHQQPDRNDQRQCVGQHPRQLAPVRLGSPTTSRKRRGQGQRRRRP